jgi:hypothetical protein
MSPVIIIGAEVKLLSLQSFNAKHSQVYSLGGVLIMTGGHDMAFKNLP